MLKIFTELIGLAIVRPMSDSLPYINNNYDFRDMLGELLGELNASHTGARYNPEASEP